MDLPTAADHGKALTNELHLLKLVGAKRTSADDTDRYIEVKSALAGNVSQSTAYFKSVNDRGTTTTLSTYHPELSSNDGRIVLRSATTTGSFASPNTTNKVAIRVDRAAGDQYNGTEIELSNGVVNMSYINNVDKTTPFNPSGSYVPFYAANNGVTLTGVNTLSTSNIQNKDKHFLLTHALSPSNAHILQVSNESGVLGIFF